MANFGERLRLLRKEKDLEPKVIGALVDLSGSTIEKYENNERTPSPSTIITLAGFFNVTSDFLLGISDIRNYDELKKLEASGQLKVLAAHRADNPMDKLPPRAVKKLLEVLHDIDEEEDQEGNEVKPND
jgi:Predicted transcriptional regulators